MPYLDEEILKKREESRKEKYCSLESGVYMDGKILLFDKKDILDAFSIMLPVSMKEMPEIYAKIKYPSEFRPQVILTTQDLSVNMGFTLYPEELWADNDNMMELIRYIQSAIKRSDPSCRMYPCVNLKEVQGGYFAFRSHAMDSDLYNVMMIAAVGENLVQGSFNCYYRDYQKWKRTVLMMWETIMMKEEEEQ